MINKITLGVLLAAVLSACATPPAIDGSQLPATPASYKNPPVAALADGSWTLAAPADAASRGEWWLAYQDGTLNRLIDSALQNNTNLAAAAARLQQARAALGVADADRMPQLGVNIGSARGTQAGAGPSGTSLLNSSKTAPVKLTSVGANFSYEIDLAGRLSGASRAASLDAEASAALLQGSRLLIASQVAQAYFSLRFLDQQGQLLQDTLQTYERSTQLTRQRYQAGVESALALARMEADSQATRAQAIALERQRAQAENALAVLLGQPASTFQLEAARFQSALPQVPAGVPAAMLARRPDVAAAQRKLLAAQTRVGVAQAAWFPDLTLTSAGGYASSQLRDIFRWSARAWSVEGLLSLPLFDGGRRQALLGSARADMELALADYRQSILQSLADVEDSLSDIRLLQQEEQAQQQAVASASRASAMADSRYRNGQTGQLDLLDAQRSELTIRRQALNIRQDRYLASLSLIRALGGSWD
jgi:multidrug efflux system outer membrane protein